MLFLLSSSRLLRHLCIQGINPLGSIIFVQRVDRMQGADQCRMPFCGARVSGALDAQTYFADAPLHKLVIDLVMLFISADLGKQRVAVYPHRRAQHCYPNGILGIADIMIAKAKHIKRFCAQLAVGTLS